MNGISKQGERELAVLPIQLGGLGADSMAPRDKACVFYLPERCSCQTVADWLGTALR